MEMLELISNGQGCSHSSGCTPESSCSHAWYQIFLTPTATLPNSLPSFAHLRSDCRAHCNKAPWVSCLSKTSAFYSRLVIQVFPQDVINSMNGSCGAKSEGEEVAGSHVQLLIIGLLSLFLCVQIASMGYNSFLFMFKENENIEHNGKCAMTRAACSPSLSIDSMNASEPLCRFQSFHLKPNGGRATL